MKALSIKQPYAHLIAAGLKTVENRNRGINYRGRVLIHASAQYHERHRDMSKFFTKKQWNLLTNEQQYQYTHGSFTLGAIIGEADIIDCTDTMYGKNPWAEKFMHHWVLANAVLYEKPILNVKGNLGLWNYEGELPTK